MIENTSLPTQHEEPSVAPCASSESSESTDPIESTRELGTLLEQLEQVSTAATESPTVVTPHDDNRLVQVRLGIAASLFAALRLKHAATACHSLRVALGSSAWAWQMGLSQEDRDWIEIAALLHDIGTIGVPDQILGKPDRLDPEEAFIVDRAKAMGLDILENACADREILDIVEHVRAWYDGRKHGHRLSGDEIPIGARMIAIVEAFDSMTTDHVYRSAMSLERAAAELFEFAGSQFDPTLVRQFAELLLSDQSLYRREMAGRWLHSLDPEAADSHWEFNVRPVTNGHGDLESMFQLKLLDSMHDAVIFVDAAFRVLRWNHGAERLTGITRASALESPWKPDLLGMENERGDPVSSNDCPVLAAIRSGVQSLRRLSIRGRSKQPVSVDFHAFPVVGGDATTLGAVLVIHDASPEATLEERCQSLHEKATKDPLTQVANRAEFDRVHEAFVEHHRQYRVPCSLIMCDLDRFKQVNDTYGHQAGDEAIKTLATLLKSSCRPGDLVARYGGEEFVILCADCDNASAARRAEQACKALGRTAQSALGGRAVTASFGVTEIQPGDTPETMLHRADRALLMAKSKGRNRVIQLGVGSDEKEPAKKKRRFWGRLSAPALAVEQDLLTQVPMGLAVEKLRGFVSDHRAKIVKIDGRCVRLEIESPSGKQRRQSDRTLSFVVDLRLSEEMIGTASTDRPCSQRVFRTRVHAIISPRKSRDRRCSDVTDRAHEVMASLRSYLMANVESPPKSSNVLGRATRILIPWFRRG